MSCGKMQWTAETYNATLLCFTICVNTDHITVSMGRIFSFECNSKWWTMWKMHSMIPLVAITNILYRKTTNRRQLATENCYQWSSDWRSCLQISWSPNCWTKQRPNLTYSNHHISRTAMTHAIGGLMCESGSHHSYHGICNCFVLFADRSLFLFIGPQWTWREKHATKTHAIKRRKWIVWRSLKLEQTIVLCLIAYQRTTCELERVTRAHDMIWCGINQYIVSSANKECLEI